MFTFAQVSTMQEQFATERSFVTQDLARANKTVEVLEAKQREALSLTVRSEDAVVVEVDAAEADRAQLTLELAAATATIAALEEKLAAAQELGVELEMKADDLALAVHLGESTQKEVTSSELQGVVRDLEASRLSIRELEQGTEELQQVGHVGRLWFGCGQRAFGLPRVPILTDPLPSPVVVASRSLGWRSKRRTATP